MPNGSPGSTERGSVGSVPPARTAPPTANHTTDENSAYQRFLRPTASPGTASTAITRDAGFSPKPLETLSPNASRWLDARGLDIELALKMGITSATGLGHGDWIAIPYLRRGVVVNHKYRRLDAKDFRQDKGGAQCWWNHDCLLDQTISGQPLIVCEGEMDALAVMQSGYQRVVSVPGGAPAKSASGDGRRYEFFAEAEELTAHAVPVILAVDGDEPGVALMNDLAVRFGKGRCRYVTYRRGCKDMNDVLLGFGAPAVVEHVNAARWVKVTGLFRMSELPPAEHPEPHHVGMGDLAKHYRLRRGDFSVVTGIPGMGKSTWVNDLACRMVFEHGWSVAFASFEQNPQIDHRRALRTWFNRKPESMLSQHQLTTADDWIDQFFSFVVPDDDEDASLEWVLEKLASAVVRFGADLVVIDPWNELDHERPKDQTLTEYVGHAIRKLKRFARKWNIHLIVVAHPTKLAKAHDGKMPIPTLYDISDSANWANKADVGVVVHRAEGENTILRVVKSRYHDSIGKPGEVTFWFNAYQARFEAVGVQK